MCVYWLNKGWRQLLLQANLPTAGRAAVLHPRGHMSRTASETAHVDRMWSLTLGRTRRRTVLETVSHTEAGSASMWKKVFLPNDYCLSVAHTSELFHSWCHLSQSSHGPLHVPRTTVTVLSHEYVCPLAVGFVGPSLVSSGSRPRARDMVDSQHVIAGRMRKCSVWCL